MLATYVLIIFMATSGGVGVGNSAISQEFNTEGRCLAAGFALVKNTQERGNHILTWGCFPK